MISHPFLLQWLQAHKLWQRFTGMLVMVGKFTSSGQFLLYQVKKILKCLSFFLFFFKWMLNRSSYQVTTYKPKDSGVVAGSVLFHQYC